MKKITLYSKKGAEMERLTCIPVSEIGKTVFLSYEEAKAKLKKLKCSISERCKGNKDIEDIER